MATPVHQGGGINPREELPITTRAQTRLHAAVHSQVRDRSQAGAPWKTSWIRTEIHGQNSPIQQLLGCPVTVLLFTPQLAAQKSKTPNKRKIYAGGGNRTRKLEPSGIFQGTLSKVQAQSSWSPMVRRSRTSSLCSAAPAVLLPRLELPRWDSGMIPHQERRISTEMQAARAQVLESRGLVLSGPGASLFLGGSGRCRLLFDRPKGQSSSSEWQQQM